MNYKSFLDGFQHSNVRVVAVSKTKTAEQILQVYASGHRDFGENKVQELLEKYEILPKDIRWHMIGHLQKNKVKYIVPFIDLIHSVDNEELLETINKEGAKHKRIVKILMQVKIASEDSKFGLDPDTLHALVQRFVANEFPHVKICGLMGMASFTDNTAQINREFESLHDLFIEIKEVYFNQAYYFKELSMGMSGDYEIAIENGSTIVRIGTLIFGHRYETQ